MDWFFVFVIIKTLMNVWPLIFRSILSELLLSVYSTWMNTVHLRNALLNLLVQEFSDFVLRFFFKFRFAIFWYYSFFAAGLDQFRAWAQQHCLGLQGLNILLLVSYQTPVTGIPDIDHKKQVPRFRQEIIA